ncbi:PREDICTED: protein timeless homolog isoform X2 [Gavialis gangeticus]|uniref:protein timeless homolog isoform X2 n=1 Tax=Gavialis gangeticus TaxID=94835 RepID=UPI00092EF895|nr:PREDICTED: protein timeless homolog isoform X2 [Gavialis gangeticus]
MNCELLATCSALGCLEGDTYHKEPDCLESVKDLIRFLRHEDETRDVRQQLGAAQILQNDLLPLLVQHASDAQLFDAVIRLLVNLTQPALLCFGKVPKDPGERHHFLQVTSHLQAYKEAFANEKVFGVLSEKLYDLLQLDWEQRQEEDALLIERILLLVRNVLHVPAEPTEEKSVDDDASAHDRVLWAVHLSGMDDLLQFLACATSEAQWALHVLEVIALMLRDQTPEQLAATGQPRIAAQQDEDARELEALRQREMAERRSRLRQRGTRHSRFGGSYIIQGLKSIGDRDVVFHKGLHNVRHYSSDLGKPGARVPRHRQPPPDPTPRRRSARNVRLFLRGFCEDFLRSGFNRLMALVKEQLGRARAEDHDETFYLWALSFFLGFSRAHGFRAELVSEALSVSAFHTVEQQLRLCYEMMLIDKPQIPAWARRMHLALKAYQELLLSLQEMDQAPDPAVRRGSHVLKNNIFYVLEFRELFLTLFRKFNAAQQPRAFLRDLAGATHLFLRLLERFCRQRRSLVVQNKKQRRRKKPRARPTPASPSPTELDALWPRLEAQLQVCAQELPEEVPVPFDAAAETPVEEQRAQALARIQTGLVAGDAPHALALLRASREVWPEGDVFGVPDASLDDEIQLLQQILSAPLPRPAEAEVEEPEGGEDEEEDEDEELEAVRVSEKEFSFQDYLKRFACVPVLRAYGLLLRDYECNGPRTNHYVARMLQRLARGLGMPGLLCQLSLFSTFRRLLHDPAAPQELVTLAKYVVGKFFALVAANQKAFVELLFWKGVGAVREMTEGYGTHEPQGARRGPIWSEEEEEQLRQLYLEVKKRKDDDVIGHILSHLPGPARTRKQVVKHLVQLGLAHSAHDFPPPRKGTNIVLWTEEQELELQRLFEEFQGTDDILGNILRHLTARRSRARVMDKLLSLGLVSERKELYKKRRRKPGPGLDERPQDVTVAGRQEDEDEEGNMGEEEEEEEEGRMEAEVGELVPTGEAPELAQSLQQDGLTGPLLWLMTCLRRAATDRQQARLAQPVPLVPLSEENEDAMEEPRFQRLLRALGLRPPASEQESFWRIPAALSPLQLRQAAASIAQGDTRGLEPAEEEEEEAVGDMEQRAQAMCTLQLAQSKQLAPGKTLAPLSPNPSAGAGWTVRRRTT